MQSTGKELIIRIVLAGVVLGIGWYMLWRLLGGGEHILNVYVAVCFAFVFLILGGILLAPVLGELFSSGFINAFLFPHRRPDPAPKYGIPESRASQGQYEEAIQLYRDITAEFPGRVKPYRDMIDICLHRLHDPERAEQIYQEGINNLQTAEARERLKESYAILRQQPREYNRERPGTGNRSS